MVLHSNNRVRLSVSDWTAIGSLAVALLALIGATLYQVHDLAAESRARQARFDIEVGHLKGDVRLLQEDVRSLLRRY